MSISDDHYGPGKGPHDPKDYEGTGMTKQSFLEESLIGNIMQRAQRDGGLSHLERHGASYGDFAGFDYFEAQTRLAEGRTIFEQLPSEIRREFKHDPAQFFEYVNDPENAGRLPELLPELAKPGKQFVQPVRPRAAEQASLEDSPAPSGAPEEGTPGTGVSKDEAEAV